MTVYLRIEPKSTPRNMRESRECDRVECGLARTRYYSKAYVTPRDRGQSNGIQYASAIDRR